MPPDSYWIRPLLGGHFSCVRSLVRSFDGKCKTFSGSFPNF